MWKSLFTLYELWKGRDEDEDIWWANVLLREKGNNGFLCDDRWQTKGQGKLTLEIDTLDIGS